MSNAKMWLIAVALLVGFVAYKNHGKQQSIPVSASLARLDERAPASALADAGTPCEGRDRCVLVYVAPWCSASKQMISQLLPLRNGAWKDSSDRSVEFVIGKGTPEESRAMAQRIGQGAFIDTDGEFARKMKVDHFPTVWVVGASGKVLKTDASAISWLNQETQNKD